MRLLWVSRDIGAPAATVWDLLTDLEAWPRWGPSVRTASLAGDRLERGARGSVTTAVGVSVPFEVTTFEPGSRWGWRVGGIGATEHLVEPAGPDRCRVSFGVPWAAAPYLAVCRVALARLERLAA